MNRYWLRSLALSLGFVVASGPITARAQQPIAATPPVAAAALGKPVVIASAGNAAAAAPAPAVSIGRPTVIASGGPEKADDVRPVSYAPSRETPAVFRGQAADSKPMPVGPSNGAGNAPNPFGWQRNDGVVATSRNEAAPPPGGPTLPAPTPMGAAGGATVTPSPVGAIPLPVGSGGPVLIGTNAPGLKPGLGIPLGVNPADCNCPGGCATAGPAVAGPAVPMVAPYGGDPSRFVLSADYLLWWFKGDRTPPLAATAPVGGTGLPGDPGTSVLYGGNSLGGGQGVSGVRANAQWWLGEDKCWAIDLGGFIFANNIDRFRAESGGNPQLNRPILGGFEAVANPATPTFPNLTANTGFIAVERSSIFYGYDANARFRYFDSENFTLDLIGGYRHLSLRESLSISEFVFVTGPNALGGGDPVGTNFRINDTFRTRNRFDGAQVGFDARYYVGAWSFGLLTKFAFGVTEQSVDISGVTVRQDVNGTTATAAGGLLALPGTNIGTYRRSKFSYAPEVGFNVGYALTDWCRVNGGYNFMYWSNVARPGGQIDTRVNTQFVPFRGAAAPTGPAFPAPLLRSTDFMAHGFNFGLEFLF